MKKAISFLLALAFGAVIAIAAKDNPYTIQYKEADGLLSASPNCISQDREGFIWIGTKQGLFRFDGYHFKCYDNARNVHSIFTGEDGTIWAGTEKGIVLYSTTDGRSRKFDTETEWNVSVCCRTTILSQLNDGSLFIGTEGQGFFIYNFRTGKLRQVCRYASMISAMATYGDSLMFIGSEESTISEFTQEGEFRRTISTAPEDSDLRLSNIKSLSAARGQLWAVLQNRGLGYIALDSPDSTAHFRQVNPEGKFCISASDGNLLVAGANSIAGFGTGSRTASTILAGLPSNPRCLFEDRDGGIWTGLEDEGIIYYPGRECGFMHILDGKSITALAKDSSGMIWAGASSGTIFRCTDEGTISGQISIGASQIQCIMADLPEIWVGTRYDGLYVHNLNTGKTENFRYDRHNDNSIGDNGINAIFKDSRGKIYVGTEWGFCYYEHDKGFIFEPRGSNHSNVTGFYEDSMHNIWILTGNDGIFRENIDGSSWLLFNTDRNPNLHSNIIHDMTEGQPGTIWLAMDSGLYDYSYNTKSFSRSGLSSESIAAVEIDNEGRIWYTNGKEITCIAGQSRHTFSKESGLHCDSYIRSCSISADNGVLFFGGMNGLDIFAPDTVLSREAQLRHNSDRPVRITDILTDGVSSGVPGRIITRNDVKSISFMFSDLEFRPLGAGSFSYMLKGEDKDWIQGGPTATYGKLAPGKYTFMVRKNGGNDQDTISIPLKIRFPVYDRWWAFMIYLCLLSIIILSIINISRRKQEEATFKEKYSFFTNIIHEIRTPLTLIKTPLDKLLDSGELSGQARSGLDTINKGADTLINLVNQLLDYRKSESGYYVLNLKECNISSILTEICERFRAISESEGKTLVMTLPEEQYEYKVDPDAFEKIISNLLSNAVKYADSRISITLEARPSDFNIQVSNDGARIDPAERESIFKMFYQIKGSKKGTGIGLPLARMLAERHGGTLTISPDSQQTTFVLSIPGERMPVSVHEAIDRTAHETPSDNEEKQRILIIDDNEDLRKMIAEMLRGDYDVFQAADGKEGVDILEKEAIDIVLSDVMMPEMDGYEFCEFLKSDRRYCNIPIILLTAKTAVKDKIKGLKFGADDYIEKPFSQDLLTIKVKSVLDNRKKIKEFYRGLPVVHPSQMAKITKNDSDFIVKMKAELEKHLSEVDYNMVTLAEDMYMSQSSFYRKVKTLTGVSPNDFVKEFKLQRAAEMLSDGQLTVTDVYKKVGFNSVSYFSLCFKKKYGMSPTKYVDSLK